MTWLGILVALGACASQTSETFPATVVPGKGKDLAAFQQDEAICRQHALAHTGYSALPPGADFGGRPSGTAKAGSLGETGKTSAAGVGSDVGQEDADGGDEVGFLQCMAARGNTVQVLPGYAAAGLPFVYGAPYWFGGYYGGVELGFGYGGWRHGGWHGGHWGHGGLAHAGGHGGGGHGGGGHR